MNYIRKKQSTKKSGSPFDNLVLDKEEQAIERAFDKGEYKSVKNLKETRKFFEEAAKTHLNLQKSKRISIRVNQLDLLKVKAKAKNNRVPYQTLLSALIHQYAEGKTRLEL